MTDVSPAKVFEDLGDGLIMRSARREEADALAEFCAKVFIDEESGTEAYWIAEWIRDLVGKPHPTLNLDDVDRGRRRQKRALRINDHLPHTDVELRRR